MKRAYLAIGWLCAIFGLMMVCLFVFAIIDPAAVQHANDAAPHATPPTRLRSAYGLAFSLLVAVMGFTMIGRNKRK